MFIATISETQLQVLFDQLEEAFFLKTRITILMKAAGMDPDLMRVLELALNGRPNMEVKWV